jgi:pimeloyl-ACP methyl ester carboxylesterase
MNEPFSILGAGLRFFLLLCAGTLLLYSLYVLYFYVGQRSMIFPRHLMLPPPPAFQAEHADDLSISTPAGQVEAWLLWPYDSLCRAERCIGSHEPPYPLLVMAHGNGEIIDHWVGPVASLRRQGVAVLLVEYPGYGRSAGLPTEAAIVDVFVQAYDAAVAHPQIDAERVWLFGRSVGGGVVAQLAMQRPAAKLILFSTFTSVRDMAVSYRLPGRLARDPFDSLVAVQSYSGPILILHGERDSIIPFTHAERLHAAAPNSELRPLPCGHNDCVRDWSLFWHEVLPSPHERLEEDSTGRVQNPAQFVS